MRGTRNLRFTVVLLAAMLVGTGALAKVTTGRVIGTVKDQNDVPLPGVTVTVNSDSLLGGKRSTITDGAGEYSVIGLPVGLYTVIAALPGFVTQERHDVKVPFGGAAAVHITLPEGGTFEDEIQVMAETPVIDPTQVSNSQIFDATYLQNAAIGSANRSYQNMLYQAAGADSSTESAGNPSVFGSTSGENTYYIDGMDTTDPITSTFAANFNYDANELNAQFIDIAATLGGPLLRDKLWFFVAYEYVNNEQTPTFSTNTWGFEGNYPFAKLSWQAGSSWRVVGKYSGDPVTIANANALDTRYRDPAAMANRDQGDPRPASDNGTRCDVALELRQRSFHPELRPPGTLQPRPRRDLHRPDVVRRRACRLARVQVRARVR